MDPAARLCGRRFVQVTFARRFTNRLDQPLTKSGFLILQNNFRSGQNHFLGTGTLIRNPTSAAPNPASGSPNPSPRSPNPNPRSSNPDSRSSNPDSSKSDGTCESSRSECGQHCSPADEPHNNLRNIQRLHGNPSAHIMNLMKC